MASLTIQASDGSGSFGGYLALPGKTPAAAVLVIQEIFGINKVMRDLCDGFAAQGYLAFSPDLFWRIKPGIDITDQTEAEWQQAFELFQKFDVDKGIEDLKASLTTLRGHEACNGRVGSVGYCLGGKLAFLMATRSDADCNVSYYGVGLLDHIAEVKNIAKPLLMHVAREDGFVPKDQQDEVAAAVAANAHVTLHSYEGQDHAFAREGGAHYDAAAASTANQRTREFFARNLRD
ncbi:carboxymethylenebutenolidase [Tistlia consotensis]|uniref:Carboxymethylenebutenolidase n=1 Tax=Tistlia consotensis USBA 355 TaxID=560819 RepID=A0A1Y6BIE3_9PROT|nr:dienelactone hydrolase family protein [Tistlia consotensis]SMF09031.1 carboxymethylenebutenolidase [Tistlia consotensis USBA 355]SNR34902.1 carboxymethylenebutenolidase [Tistlia consotensis]